MRWIVVTQVFVTSLCFASHCPDARQRQAVIGRDTINARVILDMEPLQFALVRLYFSTGKTGWVGSTDMDGSFRAPVDQIAQAPGSTLLNQFKQSLLQLLPSSATNNGERSKTYDAYSASSLCTRDTC